MKSGQSLQLIAIFLLIFLLLGSVFYIFPLREKVEALKGTKSQAADQLQALQLEYETLDQLSAQVAKSEATQKALSVSVPAGRAQDQLILELSELATSVGLDLNAMNFSDALDQENGNTLIVAANFSGSYEDLIAFLQKVETSERLMRVLSLNVQRTGTEAVVFNLNIEAYYQ